MGLDQDIAILAQTPPLSLLDREALRLIAFSSDKRRLRAGDLLFRKGGASYGAAIVLSGSIAIDPPEDESTPLRVVGRGALIGELALLIATDHPAQSIAREESEVLIISRQLFKRVLDEFPDHAVAIHGHYAEQLRDIAAQAQRVGRKLDAMG